MHGESTKTGLTLRVLRGEDRTLREREREDPVPTTIHRVHNFSAGPAVLPVPVLEEIQRDLIALPGAGMSILEISHRSKTFEAILAQAEADIRALAGIPASYRVLFLQGGASL